MTELVFPFQKSIRASRIAVSCLFFFQGLCFATWASRIPTIQQALQLSDGTLGLVLFALPAGSMVSLPLAGWIVTKFGSRKVAITAILFYAGTLILIGLSDSLAALVGSLVLYGLAGNSSNIAINTQAVNVEAKYGRNIMASFHGLWSMAGFTAAGIGAFMIGKGVIPYYHFLLIAGVICFGMLLNFQFLVPDAAPRNSGGKLFVKPDRSLMVLGLIAFCCMMCEGAMFDWSGIYFQKVVKADRDWVGAGYTAFMCTMAAGRFIADGTAGRIGFQRTMLLSGLLITTGLAIAVIFPYLVSSIIGFLLVGLGVSSVVPMVYSEAGKSKILSPGMALAAVSSIGFLGFLIGPPVIGVVADLFSLRVSFILIAVIGLCVALIARKTKVE